MTQMMIGAIALASLVAGMFFFRFWKKTGDRFFLFFALSFTIEGLNRVLLGLMIQQKEDAPIIYLIRLASFVLILIAIIDKNRPGKSKGVAS